LTKGYIRIEKIALTKIKRRLYKEVSNHYKQPAMDLGTASTIGREALHTLISVSAPVLLVAMSAGLVISILQAITQIQESTLSFIPKILAVFFSLMFFMPYMVTKLQIFTDHVVQLVIEKEQSK
jgi:flagellar biosynthesis protein FliQ